MWKQSTLGEVCKMYQPKTISSKEMVKNGTYPVFGANGIIGRFHEYNHKEPQLLITCRGATCGAVNISEPFSWINGNAMVIQPSLEKVSLKYMEYVFRGGINLAKAITGSAQPQITRKSLEKICFSYPQLEEQHRIVTKLDEVFEEIDNSIKVVEDTLKMITSLYNKFLSSLFINKSNEWKHIPLKEICIFSQGVQVPINQQSEIRDQEFDTRFLRIIDFTQGSEKPRYIKKFTTRDFFLEDDVAVVRYGASTGFVCSGLKGQIANNLFKITPNNEILEKDYLKCFLESSIFSDFIKLKISGAAMPAINFKMFDEFKISFPKELIERKNIVQKANELLKIKNSLVQLQTRKLQSLKALKLSFLSQELKEEVREI